MAKSFFAYPSQPAAVAETIRAGLNYDGRIEAYDGRVTGLKALAEDLGTRITGSSEWRSSGGSGGARSAPHGLHARSQNRFAHAGIR